MKSLKIQETLNNPKYSEDSMQKCKIIHEQPMKPLDKEAFWVQYVRHKIAFHLRTRALNLNFYQHLLLDVTAFIYLNNCANFLCLVASVTLSLHRLLLPNISRHPYTLISTRSVVTCSHYLILGLRHVFILVPHYVSQP